MQQAHHARPSAKNHTCSTKIQANLHIHQDHMVGALDGGIFGDHIDGLKAIISDMHLSPFTQQDAGFVGLEYAVKGSGSKVKG